ncbi:hypothetical protein EASAB2608_07844 [Streptomyces sp. EAS-AB2608]|uniref:hypothetical protein n=1 Tax=Streptomyces sp. EAS-AB2608 TaxID=2779671 RepID=UPI001BF0A5CC|nr:hypothetical protein [Streptomyces sp. EAS-AB2608]BCM72510.1 hypothetical protein EASAB2608_07844 [Streptomyces sp. EAS-AB2608]
MAIGGLARTLPEPPAEVREGTPTPRATWDEAATGLAGAITGLWPAPVGPPRRDRGPLNPGAVRRGRVRGIAGV